MKKQLLLASLLIVGLISRLDASVADSSQTGFTLRYEMSTPRTSAQIYAAITEEVARWWDPSHTWSGDAGNLSIRPEANGCFCEKLPGGGSVVHMQVVYAMPGETLRMTGALGPLQQWPVKGVMTFVISGNGETRKLTMTYAVGGYVPGGLASLAGIVDKVMTGQFKRLGDFLDRN